MFRLSCVRSGKLRLGGPLLASLFVACSGGDGSGDTTAFTSGQDTESSGGTGDAGDGDSGTTTSADDTTSGGDGDSSGDGDGDEGESSLDRPEDPVVMLGAQIPGLKSAAPGDIVAFARQAGAWVQIPVQVDERAVVDFCEIYGKSSGLWNSSPACKTDQVVTALFYTDTETFTGADPDALFDDDDELVFMARDAGGRVGTWEEPAGVVAGSAVEVEVFEGGDKGFVYLFEREDTSLDPGAGQQYVSYDFALSGGIDYKTEYDLYGYNCGGSICDPSMLEDSTITGATYSYHFAARWVSDELRITAGDATGVDILDVHQNRFDPDSCGRSVLTFSTAEGAYVVNKSGPVRALRSYIGANSGPLTQRVHKFYDERQDIVTHLRVHQLAAGMMDLFDFSTEAIGMTYYNSLNPDGLTIDGVSETADESSIQPWDLVTGEQGSLVMTNTVDTTLNIDFAHFFWADEMSPSFNQCDNSNVLDAPDGSALGTSGLWLDGALADTDPKNGSSDHLMATRTMYFAEPDMAVDDAIGLVLGVQFPLFAHSRSIDAGTTSEPCGDNQCDASEMATCPMDCQPIDGSCGDGLCLPPETSTSCDQDCPGGEATMAVCGNGTCEVNAENQLTCPQDCWGAGYVDIVTCVEAACDGLFDACADEPECVDLVVCIGPCVAMGGTLNQCNTDCIASEMPGQASIDAADEMLACGAANSCLP